MVSKTKQVEFEALVPDLLRRARVITGNTAQAEDLAQDALLAVWHKLSDGAEIADLRPYLMAVLRYRHMRAPLPALSLEEDALPPAPDRTQPYLAAREVLDAITRLPDDQARLLYGSALGQSYDELALACALPKGTVMSRLSRARQQLRRDLDMEKTDGVHSLL